ncbi:MAG TPA: alpha/beta hydrolase domain-containing protein [Xanthobacteraceae bacterium]|nr:alpha/beta hydrolase domain-containing protein [Xanthobacteraceae bacterium]
MRRAIPIIAGVVLLTTAAEARVTRIEILRAEPFAAGQAFGNVGPYQKVVGRFHGELDPAAPLNATIVDLDKAPRNARGQVEYASDFYILRPTDLAKGNGALLYDVNNRGNKRALIQFNSAPASNDPSTPAQAGNGFLMRQGYSVVWSGWIPGLPADNNALRIEVPAATGASGAIEQTVWDELLFNNATTKEARLSFRPATPEGATLLVRDRNADEPKTVPADQWEFADPQTVRLLPAGTAFRIGAIYQLVYRAANPPVSGIGFAATRDLVSFLRHDAADEAGTANPLALEGKSAIGRALAHGTSQSGRYLRDFVYRGFNEDERNRIVFEGINPHVATARLFLNQRFAQPNRMVNLGHGFMFYPDVSFPFAYETQTDPFTGAQDGILARCSARANCPKIIHTNTGTEYWQSGQSLVTTDALGRADGAGPENVRIYHFAGTHHVGTEATMPKGVCAMPPNHVDYSPLLRADLVALDRWVSDGAPPPPSRHPRIADGSLVEKTAPAVAIPGFVAARGPNPRPRFDYGPDFAKGIITKTLPVALTDRYPVLVPKVDRDGNETTGVVLPDVAVPVATTTGWSVRGAAAGGAGELCYLDGSYLPFAKTKAEREATGDGRLSLEERYQGPADYAAKIRDAAVALQKDGLLLPEDVERITARASLVAW